MLCRAEAIVQAIVAMGGIEAVYLRVDRYSAAACLLLMAVPILGAASRDRSFAGDSGRSPPASALGAT